MIVAIIVALFILLLVYLRLKQEEKNKQEELIPQPKDYKKILDSVIIEKSLNPKTINYGYWVKVIANQIACTWKDTEINGNKIFEEYLNRATSIKVIHKVNYPYPFEYELSADILK